MNKSFLIGRLTKDVELRYTTSNKACAEVDIAINNGKDSEGNDRPADYIRVVVWEKQAENLAKYQKKGSQIAVEGSIKNQSWEDEQGNKKYKTYVLAQRVQFLDSQPKSEKPLPEEPEYMKKEENPSDPFAAFGEQQVEITDNDLPF